MSTFIIKLREKIESSIYNNYGTDNYDSVRFGNNPVEIKMNFIDKFKNFLKKNLLYKKEEITLKYLENLTYKDELNFFWNNLNDKGKVLLIEIVAYNLMGYTKLKLSRNNKQLKKLLLDANKLADFNDALDPNFMHFMLYKMDLNPIGKKIKFYLNPTGITIDFMLEQYSYSENNKKIVCANLGDVVLDIGGCWGDTALYFADKVGEKGVVYTFEFIPNSIKIFEINTSLNPDLNKRINLIKNPVSDKSGDKIYYLDNGPGSQVKFEPFDNQTGIIDTISVDDFVEDNNLLKVDFIKMDIEGAEPLALIGAIKTIKKFRPQLAIAIYHSMSDFVNIPKWILDLDLGYEIYIDHYTIFNEETILYAKIKD